MMSLTANTKRRRALRASDEIHKYTDDILELTKLRDKALQHSRLYANKETYEAEVARYTTQIEMAQKVQMFLMSDITEEF